MSLIQSFTDAVQRELRRELNDMADHLAGGGAQSFEQYQHSCGVIQGLARAESYLLDLAKKAASSDDDDT